MFSHLFILFPLLTARTSCWKIAILGFSGRSTDSWLPGRIIVNEGRGRADEELVPVMLAISMSLLLPFIVMGCSAGDICNKVWKMSETKRFEVICTKVVT